MCQCRQTSEAHGVPYINRQDRSRYSKKDHCENTDKDNENQMIDKLKVKEVMDKSKAKEVKVCIHVENLSF